MGVGTYHAKGGRARVRDPIWESSSAGVASAQIRVPPADAENTVVSIGERHPMANPSRKIRHRNKTLLMIL